MINKRNKFDGFFSDWNIGYHTATNNGYGLWISDGYLHFRDSPISSKSLLVGFGTIKRWKLWRELKREIYRRAIEVNIEKKISIEEHEKKNN